MLYSTPIHGILTPIETFGSVAFLWLRECWLSNLSEILGGICRTWEFDRWYTWSVLYLDLHLKIDSERRSRTKLYYIRDYFNFPIVNFPFICSNIPATPNTLQVYQRSNSQVRHIPPKISDKFESQHSLSPTIWSDVRVDIKRFFFHISRGEYVKHFVIDAYL
jgi:hypothetical protein